MKHLAAAKRLMFKPKHFTSIVMMLLIWAGLSSASFAGISTDLRNREYLRGRAVTIANALPPSDVAALQGNNSDLESPTYSELKTRLQQIRANNRDLRFVYLYSKTSTSVTTLVDSELSGSPTYSNPGSVYPNPTERLKNSFGSTDPTIDGPFRNQWGIWMAALAPVIDPSTQEVIAVVGIQTSAATYYSQIALYALVPLLLAAIPFAGLLRDIKIQSKEHEILHLKNQFVSIASHELRSPLAGMLWAIHTLSKEAVNRLTIAQLRTLTDMYQSTESSLATVNEILDMSIFERGQASKLQHEFIDIASVIKQVAGTLRLGAQEKDLAVEPIGVWPKQIYTYGDVAALRRAFMNVVSNAIKYSVDHTTIELTHKTENNEHVIGVRDHGIGIPEAELPKVLEGYYRATNATAMQAHGTGLGLWVTRKVIEEHGGRLWIESKINQGTTVFVALPVAEPPKKEGASLVTPVPSLPVGLAPQDQGSPSKDISSHHPAAHD
jgi:signal transduction histidine kinase